MARGLNAQQTAYAQARAAGLDPKSAGMHAGYSQAGMAVTVCRLEKRADIRSEVARLKKGGPSLRDEIAAAAGVENEADKWAMKEHYDTPLDLFRDVWNNPLAPKSLRYQAAKDAAPFIHARKESGKKDEQAEAAKKAGAGKFKRTKVPKLHAIQGGKR